MRLLAMFFVTILHTLGHGGVLNNTMGIKNDIAYLLEIIAYCAVNCYAIISGFVMYTEKEKPYRYSKYITMWLQVFLYSFGISLLAFIIKGSDVVSIKFLIKSALPVITKRYWYFSSYTALFFVIPLLNKLVRTLTKRQLTKTIILLFVIFSCVGRLKDPFYVNGGYSFTWLAILYLFGAWLNKCDIPSKIKSRYAFGVLVISVLVTWLFKAISPVFSNLFVSYLSPTVVLNALCLVIVFSNLHINNAMKNVVKFLSPAAFGVYLIHEQGLIKSNFIADKFIWIADLDWWFIPMAGIGCALCIFVICLIIEEIRIALFKLLRINKTAENICFKVETFIGKHLNKISDYVG